MNKNIKQLIEVLAVLNITSFLVNEALEKVGNVETESCPKGTLNLSKENILRCIRILDKRIRKESKIDA